MLYERCTKVYSNFYRNKQIITKCNGFDMLSRDYRHYSFIDKGNMWGESIVYVN